MASQRDIRRRIAAVKNIKQITRAMQFVAASKLKRAQDATLSARPYSQKIDEVLADLAAVLGQDEHPLLARRIGAQRTASGGRLGRRGAGGLGHHGIVVDDAGWRLVVGGIHSDDHGFRGRTGRRIAPNAHRFLFGRLHGFGTVEREGRPAVDAHGGVATRRQEFLELVGDRAHGRSFR